MNDLKRICLKDASEFDFIKHHDYIIEFEPGGVVGDREWMLQYTHNMSVLVERTSEYINPPENIIHIYLDKSWILGGMTAINTYFGDILVENMANIDLATTVLYKHPPPIPVPPDGYKVHSFYDPSFPTNPLHVIKLCKKLNFTICTILGEIKDFEIDFDDFPFKNDILKVTYDNGKSSLKGGQPEI